MSSRSGQSDIVRVREATDLVALIGEHVALRPQGREHVGLCPFHEDHSPSLTVVTHKGNAFYKCHSCGAAGDAFKFVMDYHRKDFVEALRFLADRAGITLRPRAETARRPGEPDRAELRETSAAAAEFFQRLLRNPDQGEAGRRVIAERAIADEMVERFGLGLAPRGFSTLVESMRRQGDRSLTAAGRAGLLKQRPDGSYYDAFRHRLIFPICDEVGHPIAFGGRRLDPEDEPKYLNSSQSPIFEKSRVLYGLHLARRAIVEAREAIVTEGYTDVIACHQAGLENTVGTLGTALTVEHARILSRLCETVVLVFDGDEAGQRAADRGVEVFFSQPVDIRICVLPGGQDPDDLLRAPGGIDRFCEAIENAEDALSFKVGRFARRLAEVTTLAGQERLLADFLGELAELGFGRLQGVRKRWVVTRLSELLGIPVDEVVRAIPAPRRSARPVPPSIAADPGPSGGPSLRRVSRARRLAEHELLSILIYEPDAGTTPIAVDDGPGRPLPEWFGPADFVDPGAGRIFEFVRPCLEAGRSFTVDELLGELAEDEQRHLASSLYFQGECRCGPDGENTAAALNEAARALYDCIEKERFQVRTGSRRLATLSPEERVGALAAMLEERRQRGHLAAAIGKGVRG